jgi:hypothetical protein
VVEKRVDSPKILHESGGVGASRQDKRNANCAHCHWGLTKLSGEIHARFIMLLSLFDRTKGRVRGGKAGDSRGIKPQSGGVGASRQDKRNANCAYCNRGLTSLSSEVNARFIVLLSLIDRTQGRVRGEKACRQS